VLNTFGEPQYIKREKFHKTCQPPIFHVAFPQICQALKSKKTKLTWDASFPGIGSQSSPRAIALNADGILDIVIGAGENEYQKSEFGVLALDGQSGDLLWKHDCIDQVYGSAIFEDINGDGTPDIFIGGRSNQFFAIDGKNRKEYLDVEVPFCRSSQTQIHGSKYAEPRDDPG